MHLAISEKVAEHFDLDLMRFNLGNLLPDLHENTKEVKAISHFRNERESYENSKDSNYQYCNYEKFLQKYKNKIDDDLYLGYYSHLIADELWVQRVYIKYMRDENRRKREDQQNNYYHDFSRLNQIIRDRYNLKMNVIFEEIEILEIDSRRISKLNEGLDYDFNTTYDGLNLLLFDYEDIINYIEETSSIIIKDFLQKNLR